MKVDKSKIEITKSGSFKESTLRIKATPKAFSVLSSGIYSNKILAVVRELSCNAVDAHISAGCESRPILVHLPNSYENYFSVRDFGRGLSEEQIFTGFSTYFESDKTESNEYIGCFGLGAKAPFAYTDSFTVISTFEGYRYTYNLVVNEDQVPSIILLTKIPSDDESGLEVKVPVLKDDFDDFISEASSLYTYFSVRPQVTGSSKYYIVEPVFDFEYGQLKASKCYSNKCLAIMGNVAYPLDFSMIPGLEDKFDHYNIWIWFPLGSLEITASRESLSYNKKTIKSITDTVNEILKSSEKTLCSQIANSECYWDACVKYTNLVEFVIFDKVILYNNIQVKKRIIIPYKHVLEDKIVKYKSSQYGSTTQQDKVKSIECNKNVIFLHNDLKRGGIKTARELATKTKSVVYAFNTEHITDIKDVFGILDKHIVKASDHYVKSPVVRSQNNNKHVWQFSVSSFGQSASKYWNLVDIDSVPENFVYVPFRRYFFESIKRYNHHPRMLCQFVLQLRNNNIYIPPIIGCRKSDIKILSNKNAQSLLDYINTIMMSQEDIRKASLYESLQDYNIDLLEIDNLYKLSNISSVISESIQKIHEIKSFRQYMDRVDLLNPIARLFDKQITLQQHDLSHILQPIQQKYPLLDLLSISYKSFDKKIADALYEYIKLKDIVNV